MPESFRLGIVGCGKIAGRHIRGGLAVPGIDVTALVDTVPDRGKQFAEQYKLDAKVAASLDEVADHVDGVVIATPNHAHCQIACESLERKIPVLIEKPLATTSADGEQICQAAEKTSTVAAVGFVTRFRRDVHLIHQLISTGYFGRIEQFAYQYGAPGGWTPLSDYTLDRKMMGGGVLVTTGSHFLDRMIHWFGYPSDASLIDDASGGPEANAHVSVTFDQGDRTIQGTILFSRTTSLRPCFAMKTEAGWVTQDDDPRAPICLRPHDRPNLELAIGETAESLSDVPGPETDLFALQTADFARAIQEGTDPEVSARDGLLSLKLTDHLYAQRQPMRSEWYTSSTSGSLV